MPDVSFNSLAVVLAVAFCSRVVLGLIPRVRVPGVVFEIVLGIVVGPSVLGWAHADEPVQVLSLVGLAFLLFLSGLEIELEHLRGRLLRVALIGLGASVVLGLAVGYVLDAVGLIANPLLVGVTLTATSLGLVIPVLKEGELNTTPFGQLVIVGATLGDFTAVVLLSLLFSRDASGAGSKLILLGVFVLLLAVIGMTVAGLGRRMKISQLLVRLQDNTAQIRVRGAMLLLVALVVVAEKTGLETILGAFVAGAVVSMIDRDTAHTHPLFRVKLDAIGYGFLVPIFFITSGIRFDLDALRNDLSTLVLVPVFLLALLIARGVPALAYRNQLATTRATVAAGLLQATSLPFIVTASMIGVDIGALTPATGSAFVAAGLLSAVLFPVLSLTLLRPKDPCNESGRIDVSSSVVPPWSTERRESKCSAHE
jgi:Kef-type K+ transport system membrane component KefB